MDDKLQPRQQDTTGEIVSYWLNSDNRIVRVSKLWNQFALANEGSKELLSPEIQGRSVFEFIIGDQTRMYLEALLQNARFLNHAVNRSYRCDSPTLKRYMSMTIQPTQEGLVQLNHTLLKTEPQEQELIYCHTPTPEYGAVPRCSVCTRLLIKGTWLSPEDAKILGLLVPCKPLPVTYRICPSCRRRQPRMPTRG